VQQSSEGAYSGSFVSGEQTGRGVLASRDGSSVHCGEFVDGLAEGAACEFTPEGTYMGQFRDGSRHGRGIMLYADQSVFEGQWVDGLRVRGSFTDVDGTVYVGSFHRRKFHGQGRLSLPNGDVYEGQFEAGQCCGQGTLTTTRDGGSVHVGKWAKGVLCGKDAHPNARCSTASNSRIAAIRGGGAQVEQRAQEEGLFVTLVIDYLWCTCNPLINKRRVLTCLFACHNAPLTIYAYKLIVNLLRGIKLTKNTEANQHK
jgi:hypothetical protein